MLSKVFSEPNFQNPSEPHPSSLIHILFSKNKYFKNSF